MFRLGRLLGHEINISWTALLLFLLFLGPGISSSNPMLGIFLALATLLSILVHELGHAVVATRLGYGPCRIILHGLGGVAIHRRAPDAESIQISFAGPAAGIFLGIGLWALSTYVLQDLPLFADQLISWMLYVNLIWSILNLLPIYPLDGGHVSEVLFRGRFGPEQGRKATAFLSILVLIGAICFAVIQGYGYHFKSIIMLYIIGILFYQNWNLYQGHDSPGGFGGF